MQIGVFRFDKMELAGSLGDLGTLLPIAFGLIMLNGLSPTGLFFGVGLFYILAGLYYRVPIAVQPMKTIGSYAVATAVTAQQVTGAGLLIGLILGIIGITGMMNQISKWIPKTIIRGVQVSTGSLLAIQGFKFILGLTKFQAQTGLNEPFLEIQSLGPLPLGLLIGGIFFFLTLVFLSSKRFPAGLVAVLGGMGLGLALGAGKELAGINFSLYLPPLLPQGWPSSTDFGFAILVMTLPQLPMTLGNAVIANADLSNQYFPEGSSRVTPRSLCLSMAIANIAAFFLGGMPMCHGAGGLAAHYRFGARTSGSNMIIGGFFLALALFFGPTALGVLHLLPMSVLGVLLAFAGLQLCLTVLDLKTRNDFFVVFTMLTLTLAANLAWAFIVGLIIAYLLDSKRLAL